MAKMVTDEEDEEQFEFLRQVGLRVKAMRERSGLSRREMTVKANIKPAYGILIEGEGQNLTLRTLINIANAVGCLPRDLMPDPPQEQDLETENRLLREHLQQHLEIIERLTVTAPPLREYLEKTKRNRGY